MTAAGTPAALTLTDTEFQLAWETLGLGELPLVFAVCLDREDVTDEERAHASASAMAALQGKGLADTRGPSAELAGALALLAGPRWTVEARLVSGHPDATVVTGGSMRAVGAAGDSDTAVIATMADGVLALTWSPRFRLPADVVALAGEVQPAHGGNGGGSINVLTRVLFAAMAECGGSSRQLADLLVERGVPAADARAIAGINDETLRSGQFSVAVADQDGVLRPSARMVGFCDTQQGRWAQLRTAGTGVTDQEWITFTPVRSAQLAAMVAELLTESGAPAV